MRKQSLGSFALLLIGTNLFISCKQEKNFPPPKENTAKLYSALSSLSDNSARRVSFNTLSTAEKYEVWKLKYDSELQNEKYSLEQLKMIQKISS